MPSKRKVPNDLTNHYEIQTPSSSFENEKLGIIVPDDAVIAQTPSVTPIPPYSPGAPVSPVPTPTPPGPVPTPTPSPTPTPPGPTPTPTPVPVPTPTPLVPIPPPIPPVFKNLWLWGDNSYGQLGNFNFPYGIPPSYGYPVQTIDNNFNYASISAGAKHFGGITTDGYLWMWGSNEYGQIGDDTSISRTSPVLIGSSNDWLEVSCGTFHSAAIKTNNTLYSWGYNIAGILGQNDTDSRSSPTQVGVDTTWSSVSCGYLNTAAIKTDGTLWLWGNNSYGQLGNNDEGYVSLPLLTQKFEKSPIQVGADTDWYQVACGKFVVAALKNNSTTGAELWVWGNNSYGQLGTDDTVNRSSPVQTVMATQSWVYVDTSNNHTQIVDYDGKIWAFGNNSYGQLGSINPFENRSSPVQNIGSGFFTKVKAGDNHAVGLTDDGYLWCWGLGYSGQIGNNEFNVQISPVQTLATGEVWSDIAAGGNFTAGLGVFQFAPPNNLSFMSGVEIDNG